MPAKPKAASTKLSTASRRAEVEMPGLIDFDAVFSPTGLAHQLATAAAALSHGVEDGDVRPALEQNLELWVAIKTLVSRQNGQVDPGLRDSLLQAAATVADTTFAMAKGFSPEAVERLISLDVQLSKGLTNAVITKMTADRAYFLWQEDGGHHGSDQQYWFAAEREIREAMDSL